MNKKFKCFNEFQNTNPPLNISPNNLDMGLKIHSLRLINPFILYGCDISGHSISKDSRRKIEYIQKEFITYKIKIKGNIIYHILLIEARIRCSESIDMTRYVMYNMNLRNMEAKGFPKIVSNSNQNSHLWLKQQ